MPIVWHGTQTQAFELVNAFTRHCQCKFGLFGVRLSTCEPHVVLRDDQRAIDGLLFARSIRERLQREEFEV